MFKCYGSTTLIACKNNDKIDIHKILQTGSELVQTIVDPLDFYRYYDTYTTNLIVVSRPNPRLVLSSTKFGKLVTIYYNNMQWRIYVEGPAIADLHKKFIGDGSLVESDHITKLNNYQIKKFSVSLSEPNFILTTCGKMFLLNYFDSDITYDLSKSEILLPGNITISDIDSTRSGTYILADNGNVYKTVFWYITHLQLNQHMFIASGVKAIRCQNNRCILQSIQGDVYGTDILKLNTPEEEEYHSVYPYRGTLTAVNPKCYIGKINSFDEIDIVKFECGDNHTVVQDTNNNLYTHTIDPNNILQSVNNPVEKIEYNLYDPLYRFKKNKSANNTI